jgi:hypothetical protein
MGSPRPRRHALRLMLSGRAAHQSSNALQKITSCRASRLGSRCGSFG